MLGRDVATPGESAYPNTCPDPTMKSRKERHRTATPPMPHTAGIL